MEQLITINQAADLCCQCWSDFRQVYHRIASFPKPIKQGRTCFLNRDAVIAWLGEHDYKAESAAVRSELQRLRKLNSDKKRTGYRHDRAPAPNSGLNLKLATWFLSQKRVFAAPSAPARIKGYRKTIHLTEE